MTKKFQQVLLFVANATLGVREFLDFDDTEGTEDDNEAVEEVEKEDETEDADVEAQDAVKNGPFGGVVIGMGTEAEVDDGGEPEEDEDEGDEHGGSFWGRRGK